MNASKYRKLYLQENWAQNAFTIVKYSDSYKEEHPKILCIGYILSSKPTIFRPVFQFRRQHRLNKVHKEKHKKFWYNIYIKYMLSMPKFIPLECTKHICNMLYPFCLYLK